MRKLESLGADPTADGEVWVDYVPRMLAATRKGHHNLKTTLKQNKAVYSAHARKLEEHLPDMLDVLGVEEIAQLLQEVAEVQPRKLVKSIPALVRQLAAAVVEHQFVILGALLAVTLAAGAGPVLPVLTSVSEVCNVSPELFMPFFKVLAAVAANGGDEAALQCLIIVAKVAKSGLAQEPPHQAAVLEAMDVIKDYCKYSNLLQAETLQTLDSFAAHNPVAYKNITVWNAGKSAKRGNYKGFLVQAACFPASPASSGPRSPFWWFTFQKTASAATTTPINSPESAKRSAVSTGEKADQVRSPSLTSPTSPWHTPLPQPTLPVAPFSGGIKQNTVAPSPQSQSLALMHQQLQIQQQQLQHQMAMLEQMRQQELAQQQNYDQPAVPLHTYLAPGVFQVNSPLSPGSYGYTGLSGPSTAGAHRQVAMVTEATHGYTVQAPAQALFPDTAGPVHRMLHGSRVAPLDQPESPTRTVTWRNDAPAPAALHQPRQVVVTSSASAASPAESMEEELERLRQHVVLLEGRLR